MCKAVQRVWTEAHLSDCSLSPPMGPRAKVVAALAAMIQRTALPTSQSRKGSSISFIDTFEVHVTPASLGSLGVQYVCLVAPGELSQLTWMGRARVGTSRSGKARHTFRIFPCPLPGTTCAYWFRFHAPELREHLEIQHLFTNIDAYFPRQGGRSRTDRGTGPQPAMSAPLDDDSQQHCYLRANSKDYYVPCTEREDIVFILHSGH